ncbi:uncharacterized protein LOC126905729 [Daktulosphaira vitifoliae]|uniref:uncharacterized protein LOC126905729 n=1 Tax=Daktulosphaira vitifoliae TaxID=58002 RepID=UPI0021A9CD43|nr:uncharacterized protein LOC126905729 [Daktulosphaira vitifoliae]
MEKQKWLFLTLLLTQASAENNSSSPDKKPIEKSSKDSLVYNESKKTDKRGLDNTLGYGNMNKGRGAFSAPDGTEFPDFPFIHGNTADSSSSQLTNGETTDQFGNFNFENNKDHQVPTVGIGNTGHTSHFTQIHHGTIGVGENHVSPLKQGTNQPQNHGWMGSHFNGGGNTVGGTSDDNSGVSGFGNHDDGGNGGDGYSFLREFEGYSGGGSGSGGHETEGGGHGGSHEEHVKTVYITKEIPVPYPVHVEKKVLYPVRVPYEKPIPYPVHKPYPVHIEKQVPYPVRVHVPQPYPVTVEKHVPFPVRVNVDRPIPVHIPKPYPVYIEKKVPIAVDKPVPYPVKIPIDRPVPVHIPVEKPFPYPVEKKIPYPIKVPVDRPYPIHVYRAYPVHIEKPVPYPVKVPVKVPYPIDVRFPGHGHAQGQQQQNQHEGQHQNNLGYTSDGYQVDNFDQAFNNAFGVNGQNDALRDQQNFGERKGKNERHFRRRG